MPKLDIIDIMKKWKTLDSKIAFDNKWMMIRQDKVELPMGKVLDDYYLWQKDDVAIIVPFTQSKELIFVKQFRQGVGDFMIEFPTGFIEKDNPLKAAERELYEETGYQGHLEQIGKLCAESDKITGKLLVYLGINLMPTEKTQKIITNFEDNEELQYLKFSLPKTLEMIRKGEIWAAETIAALHLALDKIK